MHRARPARPPPGPALAQRFRFKKCKFIHAPEKSPFIENSRRNEQVRAIIQEEAANEFRRYAAVIADEATPAMALERMLRSLAIPGEVLVRP